MVNQSDLPELAAIFQAAIAAHMAPLQAEIAVLKARLDDRPAPKDGLPGRDGKDAPPINLEKLIETVACRVPVPPSVKGDRGEQGEPGQAGAAGAVGPTGPAGAAGRDGIDGASGKDGAPGIAGKDGAPGIAGKDGAPGIAGKDGAPGRDGASVDPLVIRAMVVDAVAAVVKQLPKPEHGRDGRDGKDGRDGAAGNAGRDGTLVDYVDLDAHKSYPRGTHARARGGILYAERTTDPVKGADYKAAGWRELVAGLADVRMKLLSDGRTFELALEFTDGRIETRQAKADIPAHRGVWREAVTYERGDVVQWSGNGWIAREVTTDKPGEGKGWDLLARRGRDGKDS